jgi:hypothetical protein
MCIFIALKIILHGYKKAAIFSFGKNIEKATSTSSKLVLKEIGVQKKHKRKCKGGWINYKHKINNKKRKFLKIIQQDLLLYKQTQGQQNPHWETAFSMLHGPIRCLVVYLFFIAAFSLFSEKIMIIFRYLSVVWGLVFSTLKQWIEKKWIFDIIKQTGMMLLNVYQLVHYHLPKHIMNQKSRLTVSRSRHTVVRYTILNTLKTVLPFLILCCPTYCTAQDYWNSHIISKNHIYPASIVSLAKEVWTRTEKLLLFRAGVNTKYDKYANTLQERDNKMFQNKDTDEAKNHFMISRFINGHSLSHNTNIPLSHAIIKYVYTKNMLFVTPHPQDFEHSNNKSISYTRLMRSYNPLFNVRTSGSYLCEGCRMRFINKDQQLPSCCSHMKESFRRDRYTTLTLTMAVLISDLYIDDLTRRQFLLNANNLREENACILSGYIHPKIRKRETGCENELTLKDFRDDPIPIEEFCRNIKMAVDNSTNHVANSHSSHRLYLKQWGIWLNGRKNENRARTILNNNMAVQKMHEGSLTNDTLSGMSTSAISILESNLPTNNNNTKEGSKRNPSKNEMNKRNSKSKQRQQFHESVNSSKESSKNSSVDEDQDSAVHVTPEKTNCRHSITNNQESIQVTEDLIQHPVASDTTHPSTGPGGPEKKKQSSQNNEMGSSEEESITETPGTSDCIHNETSPLTSDKSEDSNSLQSTLSLETEYKGVLHLCLNNKEKSHPIIPITRMIHIKNFNPTFRKVILVENQINATTKLIHVSPKLIKCKFLQVVILPIQRFTLPITQ